MTEMKTNESLASFEAEYTRLYEALYKSNQLGVELNAKLEELRVGIYESSLGARCDRNITCFRKKLQETAKS